MLSRRELWTRFLVYPTHTFPTAAAPIAVAAGLAAHDRVLAPLPLLVAFVGSWLIHLGGVFADQYELVRRHPQRLHSQLRADGGLHREPAAAERYCREHASEQ